MNWVLRHPTRSKAVTALLAAGATLGAGLSVVLGVADHTGGQHAAHFTAPAGPPPVIVEDAYVTMPVVPRAGTGIGVGAAD